MSTSKVVFISSIAAFSLQGCKDKDHDDDHKKCKADDLTGCWKGSSSTQDFWVNLSNDNDGLAAQWIMGPTGDSPGVLGPVQSGNATITDDGQLSFGDYTFDAYGMHKKNQMDS